MLYICPSEDVVAREIEGEFIIVPLAAGIGDMEDELYSLNESGVDDLEAPRWKEQFEGNLCQPGRRICCPFG